MPWLKYNKCCRISVNLEKFCLKDFLYTHFETEILPEGHPYTHFNNGILPDGRALILKLELNLI